MHLAIGAPLPSPQFVALGDAQAESLLFDKAMAWLDATPAGEALRDWNEAVAALLPPRKSARRSRGS